MSFLACNAQHQGECTRFSPITRVRSVVAPAALARYALGAGARHTFPQGHGPGALYVRRGGG
jgi:hypothetical protein